MKRLKELRLNLGLSQADFAAKLGMQAGTISKYERGSLKPGLDILLKLHSEFGVSIDWFLFGDIAPISDETLEIPLISDDGSASSGRKTIKVCRSWLAEHNISSDNICAMRVTGDGMFPTFRHGDILFIDMEQTGALTDRIYLIRFEEGNVIKRCGESRGNMLTFLSDNAAISPLTLDISLGNLYVAGRVVWYSREI